MVWLPENIQACLREFQTAAASMARKRHLHLPQGVFIVFVLLPDMGSRSSKGSMGSSPFYPSNPLNPW